MTTMAVRVIGVALAAALCGTGASAQTKPEARSAMLQKLVDCRKLTEEPARLACYDAATAALDQAEAKGDVVIVDREQARKVRRQAFGFSLPSMSLFERGESEEELENVNGRIGAVRFNNSGKLVLRLEDGATWEQTDVTPISLTPKPGQSVKIRKATLGSYLLSVDGHRAYRAKRVE
jgi:hypothetical protein